MKALYLVASWAYHNLAFVTDVHEPRLEVKNENLGTHSTGGYLGATGSQSRSQLGGQSPRYRLTSQRGRQSELYLPGLVPRSGKDALENREEVPINGGRWPPG